jgi:hypothetical protein
MQFQFEVQDARWCRLITAGGKRCIHHTCHADAGFIDDAQQQT